MSIETIRQVYAARGVRNYSLIDVRKHFRLLEHVPALLNVAEAARDMLESGYTYPHDFDALAAALDALERGTGIEPAASTLEESHSTN